MESFRMSNSPRGATPRTPHSPSSTAPTGAMDSPRPSSSSSAPVRPVTARTWQALAAPPGAEPRRVSVYTNDLYNNGSGGSNSSGSSNPERGPDARPASPLYQPASARPGTPTPRSAERLQQQRIATPSRLAQAERAGSPSQRLQQQQQQVVALGLSTANVPTAAAEGLEHQSDAGNAVPTAALAAVAATAVSQQGAMGKHSSPLQAAQQAQGQKGQGQDLRPGIVATSTAAATSSPRISSISLTSLRLKQEQKQQLEQQVGAAAPAAAASPRPASAAGGSIALDSPRVRQQALRNFAGALPAGSSAGSGSPRLTLHGERDRASVGGNRPSTPSFQPVAAQSPRPATALPGSVGAGAAASPAAAAPHFSIKAAHGRALSGLSGAAAGGETSRPVGAYPQPPMTAPPKAPAQAQAPGSQQQPQPGSLASFGIASAAFIAAAPKAAVTAMAAAACEGEAYGGKAALPVAALTQAAMLASASFVNKAELRRFLLTPGPADKPLCCKILRSGGGLLKGSPQYTLFVEQEGGKAGAFLLAARKRKGGPSGATYVMSVDQHDVSRHSPSYVGKVRSNFIGTEFVFYDAGDKHSRRGSAAGRCELGAALYQTNVLGTKGPRKMTLLIPKLEPGGQRPLALSPHGEQDTLLGRYRSYNLSSCVVLRNKPPRWNQAVGAYCLNFGGRVTQASVKNFQLVSVDNMERTILQFGKVAGDAFTMDYSYPMTALQAFAICLTSFDSKLACE